MAHTFNPRTQEAEAEKSVRPAWSQRQDYTEKLCLENSVDVPFLPAPIPKNKVQGIIKPFKVVEVVLLTFSSATQTPSLSSLAQHRPS